MQNCVFEVVKHKTDIRGFWKDERGKLYIDNIRLVFPKNAFDFNNTVNRMFLLGEKEVFTIGRNEARSLSFLGNDTIFKNRITWSERRIKPSFINELLKNHNGFTIYKEKFGFKIELWKE